MVGGGSTLISVFVKSNLIFIKGCHGCLEMKGTRCVCVVVGGCVVFWGDCVMLQMRMHKKGCGLTDVRCTHSFVTPLQCAQRRVEPSC
jgi:hypothetical protein